MILVFIIVVSIHFYFFLSISLSLLSRFLSTFIYFIFSKLTNYFFYYITCLFHLSFSSFLASLFIFRCSLYCGGGLRWDNSTGLLFGFILYLRLSQWNTLAVSRAKFFNISCQFPFRPLAAIRMIQCSLLGLRDKQAMLHAGNGNWMCCTKM